MLKKISESDKGFTIIELMTVVGVIAILAAIAIPNYLGMQDRAKRKVMMEVAASAKPELRNWMEATLNVQKGVIDVNGNGLLEPGEMHTNLMTVPNSWIQAYVAQKGFTPLSPWGGQLFTVAPSSPVNNGQIVFSIFNNGRGIRIHAYGKAGQVLYNDSVSID